MRWFQWVSLAAGVLNLVLAVAMLRQRRESERLGEELAYEGRRLRRLTKELEAHLEDGDRRGIGGEDGV